MSSLSLGTFLVFAALLAIACVLFLGWRIRRLRRSPEWVRLSAIFMPHVNRLAEIPFVRSSRAMFKPVWQHIPWRSLVELSLIAAWALWVGRAYLDFNPNLWPHGAEFGMVMQSHFPWTWLPQCGLCALWDGSINGGAPTLADVYGAVAHPLVVGAMLVFGLINSAKFILLCSLALAGIAQWWLARVMHLSWLPRLWVAFMAVVGGHLAGRMYAGLVIFVFSIASVSLLLAPTLQLVQTGNRRTAVILGVLFGLALLSGQGYMQVAVVFGLIPALLVFVIGSPAMRFPWKEFALAGIIAVLIAAVLWMPMLHFWPNVAKDSDPTLRSVQPLPYIPLNLVINDYAFYENSALGKTTLTFLYVNYIGWVPVLLALAAICLVPRHQYRLLLFFLVALGLVFLLSSGLPIIVLRDALGFSLTGIRFPSLIASAAVPLLLGLSAWGFDLLLRLERLFINLNLIPTRRFAFQVKPIWLIMAICAGLATWAAYDFSKAWLGTVQALPPQQVLATWQTKTTEWVYPPFGEAYWLPFGLNAGLKMVTVSRPWQWKDRQPPEYAIEAVWNLNKPPTGPVLGRFDELTVVAHPGVEYAYVNTGGEPISCRATAIGGDINVDCQNDQEGTLIVEENNWSGWYASRDGEPLALANTQWLSVPAPAGQHHYEFRYRPWDVLLGLILTMIGFGLAITLWIRSLPQKPTSPPSQPPD